MGITKAALHILERVFKGDCAEQVAKSPLSMDDQGQFITSSYRAFRLYGEAPLLQGELTAEERERYCNIQRMWDAAVQRNKSSLTMPSSAELNQYIREQREMKSSGRKYYSFPEGIALNANYLRDLHTVLGKVETLMWDGNRYHPVTVQTERGSAILLPWRVDR